MAAECDINQIMNRFEKTGILEHVNTHQGKYGNFLEISDYQTALNHVISAQDSFMSLPSQLRARFENDPGQFLSFVNNPDNIEEMQKMGLIPKNDNSEEIEAKKGESREQPAELVQSEA